MKRACGFQSLSNSTTMSAVARLMPRPPARVESRNTNLWVGGGRGGGEGVEERAWLAREGPPAQNGPAAPPFPWDERSFIQASEKPSSPGKRVGARKHRGGPAHFSLSGRLNASIAPSRSSVPVLPSMRQYGWLRYRQ